MDTSIDKASDQLGLGGIILLIDDAATPVAGYLLCAAISVSSEDICTMANFARGIVCAPLPEERIGELGLPMMTRPQVDGTPDFTVSVEARQGVTTGISASDRARTLRTLAKTTQPKIDLVTPGHIFPMRAKVGGVLVRTGPAEAAVDLLTLSGTAPVGALTQCLDEQGGLPNESGLKSLAAKLRVPILRLSEVIRARLTSESIVEKLAEAKMPTFGAADFRASCFRSKTDGAEHLALVMGELSEKDESGAQKPVLVRVHSEDRIGDLLGTSDVQSRSRLLAAMEQIRTSGRGALIYVRHPKKGLLREQMLGRPKVQGNGAASELRQLGIGAQILQHLGIKRIRLLTNSSRDISGAEAFELEILERVPLSLEKTGALEKAVVQEKTAQS